MWRFLLRQGFSSFIDLFSVLNIDVFFSSSSQPREQQQQQIKIEPCTDFEMIAIRACAATLCCGIITEEWFQKTVVHWLDQFMAAHEVKISFRFLMMNFCPCLN